MDHWDGLIIGAGIAAIVTVLVTKWFEPAPVGGSAGNQPAVPPPVQFGQDPTHPLYVVDLTPTPGIAAPVAQVNPNTEAAYNVQPIVFEHAFGPSVNQPADGAEVLPQ